MIKIFAVAGTAPLSKLIMYATGENVSHMAFGYDLSEDGQCGIVFQADLMGCRVMWQKDFWKNHLPRYELQVPCDDPVQKQQFLDWMNQNDGVPYDGLKLASSGVYTLSHKLFNTPIPDESSLELKQAVLCNDLAASLPLFINRDPASLQAIRTPLQTFQAIASQHPEWKVIISE